MPGHNGSGFTALMEASASGYTEIVALLIRSGADIAVKDGNGYTPLMEAARYGQTGVVKILAARGDGSECCL